MIRAIISTGLIICVVIVGPVWAQQDVTPPVPTKPSLEVDFSNVAPKTTPDGE